MAVPPVVAGLLRSAAPTLLAALALPPPFNLIASAVAGVALQRYLPAEDGATAPGAMATGAPLRATPEALTEALLRNAADPEILRDLQKAEAELKRFEAENDLKFAELGLRNLEGARGFQRDAGIAAEVLGLGKRIIWIALGALGLVVAGCFLLVGLGHHVPAENQALLTASFGLVGTAVGFINGVASQVVGFYYGSSQGSKEKGDAIAANLRQLGAAVANPPPAAPPAEAAVPVVLPERVRPAPSSLLAEELPRLTALHRLQEDGVAWALTADGIALEGEAARGTAGEPRTVRDIWARYGALCAAAARKWGVPVELIVATIATESRGDPASRRSEPQLGDESVGLMQTLVKTAREALGEPALQAHQLLDPAKSIDAGTACIAAQRAVTHFDPPLVAAAYNAGSLRRDPGEANRWKLLCHPPGTGRHIDSFVAWFNDAMRVGRVEGWSAGNDAPGFGRILWRLTPRCARAPGSRP